MPFVSADGTHLEPSEVLTAAVDALSRILCDMRASSVYVTKPMYVTDQADFLNMAVCGGYGGTPRELLDDIHSIENAFGRNRARERVKGPRPLDIDIALFGSCVVHDAGGDAVLSTPTADATANSANGGVFGARTDASTAQPLYIPHPFLNERQYVLIPLLEILPDSADPITERKFSDILSTLPDQGVSLWKCSKQNRTRRR